MAKKEYWDLMGKVVTINKILDRYKHQRKVNWHSRKISPIAGWIVGTRVLQEGEIKEHTTDSYAGYYDPPEYYAYLDVTNTIRCLLVSLSPYANPKHVPLDGFSLGGNPGPTKLSPTHPYRAEMREIMKDHPRDSKGRWLK